MAAAITLAVPTRITASGIANDTIMRTTDIIVVGAPGRVSTATDAFVRGASPYRTASANHIADTEIYLPDELSVRSAEKFRYFCVRRRGARMSALGHKQTFALQ
jgi:hypothetical protein